MLKEVIYLPSVIIDTHCHGRDMNQSYKTTVKQTLSEARRGLITTSFFMPNTDPPIINLEVLERYLGIIDSAKKELGMREEQYVYFGATDDNLTDLEEQIWQSGGFWAIELNFSCPNTPEDIKGNIKGALHCVQKVKVKYPKLILVAKISVVHPPEFAQQLREVGADVLHAVNTIPYKLLFPDKVSPLHKVGGGGVSGGPAFEMAFEYNSRVIEFFRGLVILGCGITDDKKLGRYVDLLNRHGSSEGWAISLCTAALRRPEWVKEVINNFNS